MVPALHRLPFTRIYTHVNMYHYATILIFLSEVFRIDRPENMSSKIRPLHVTVDSIVMLGEWVGRWVGRKVGRSEDGPVGEWAGSCAIRSPMKYCTIGKQQCCNNKSFQNVIISGNILSLTCWHAVAIAGQSNDNVKTHARSRTDTQSNAYTMQVQKRTIEFYYILIFVATQRFVWPCKFSAYKTPTRMTTCMTLFPGFHVYHISAEQFRLEVPHCRTMQRCRSEDFLLQDRWLWTIDI